MLRLASLALLLLLAAAPSGLRAQDRTPAPASIAPPLGTTHAPALSLPEAKSIGTSDDCAAALRREDAAHQRQAMATNTPPAPLELPPECGGAPAPPASK